MGNTPSPAKNPPRALSYSVWREYWVADSLTSTTLARRKSSTRSTLVIVPRNTSPISTAAWISDVSSPTTARRDAGERGLPEGMGRAVQRLRVPAGEPLLEPPQRSPHLLDSLVQPGGELGANGGERIDAR